MEGHGLSGDDVLERTTLPAGEDSLVDGDRVFGFRQDAPASRSAKGLVRGERDDVGTWNRIGIYTAGNQAGHMCRIEQEVRADLVGDCFERFWVDTPRIARRPGDDHLRTMLQSQIADLVHVDALVSGRDLVGDEVVELAADVDRRPVGEMTTVIEAQPQDRVADIEHCLVRAHVGVGAAVRLHVGVVGSEQSLDTLDRQRLDIVDHCVTAVVALSRVALRVLVGEHRPDGTHDSG